MDAILGVWCTLCILYSVYAILSVHCTQCILYSVYAVLGVSWTWCILYWVYAVLSVCCTQCELMIMAWREREGWLYIGFCNDGRVVDKKERDRGWRWEQCGGYEQICEIRGRTCLYGLGRPRICVIMHQIGTCTCRSSDGKLTRTWNSLKSQFLILLTPISFDFSLSCPQLYHYLKTWS